MKNLIYSIQGGLYNMSDFSTSLSKVNDAYFPMIEKQLSGKGIVMGQYARQCVMTAISAINAVLDSNQLT